MIDQDAGAILDASPEPLLVLGDRGLVLGANPAAGAFFGIPPEELCGLPAGDLFTDGIGPPVAGGPVDRVGRRADGRAVPVEVRVGTAGGGRLLVCCLRDASERRREHEELDRFFRLSLDMLCIAGLDGYFKRLNPAWERTLGHSVAELLAVPFEYFVHPDDRELTRAEMRRISAGADTVAFENRYRCRDGSYRWILWNSTPFLNEGLVMAIAHDITERKRAEDQLRTQNLRLQEIARSERQALEALKLAEVQLVQAEKLTALGQLVAGVAHEINNPLAFLSNNVAVLRRDVLALRDLVRLYQEAEAAGDDGRGGVLDRVREQADRVDLPYVLGNVEGLIDRSREGLKRIQGIVAGLRDFARMDSGGLAEVDLSDCLRSTANLVAGRADHQGVELAVDLAPLPPIVCDPGKVNQVVLNLLTNALDACPDGGRIALKARPRPGGDGVEIQVIDTGPGIEPAIRDRIFDPFFTTKPVGKGTGLGLSISYGIVREHGGEIAVDSAPGRGTRFTVTLPSSPRPDTSSSPSRTIPLNRYKQG